MTRPIRSHHFFALLLCLAILSQVLQPKTALADRFGVPTAEKIKLLDGFAAELVHEVQEGSWVSLTMDPKGRLIACDQYGGLYRTTIAKDGNASVEDLNIEVEGAQGMLCAFGSLYINVNSKNFPPGVWRLTDTNGDGQYDSKEHLIRLNGGSEHGPHALIKSHDGKRIVMCAGNNTDLPHPISRSRVPRVWKEDHLLGRMPDARGHNAKRMAPGGFIVSFNPDGSDIELIATGFRNEYDIALNKDGELFTYDADMEWDVGTPWYRPTRINHVISGAEFGWRNGTGKWPAYYPDSFGSVVDIGPGSPTGICFGYGTDFPPKYQDALFICDWSYGNIHAVHMSPDGTSYKGTYETFATSAPLPVTDIVAREEDGALYFTIGGRKTQSALYRITYTGKLDDADATEVAPAGSAEKAGTAKEEKPGVRSQRLALEKFHSAGVPATEVPKILKQLGSPDRATAFAARIAIEHQPVIAYRDLIESLDSDGAKILAIMAMARHGDATDQKEAVQTLSNIEITSLSEQEKINLLRAYALVSLRLENFGEEQRATVSKQISPMFPGQSDLLNRELAQMLVHLQVPDATQQIVNLLGTAGSQEEQIHYAMTLRDVMKGWDDATRESYFGWFAKIQSARGGMSFGGFIENIKNAALSNVPEPMRETIESQLAAKKKEQAETEHAPREFVQKWTPQTLTAKIKEDFKHADFEIGKTVFAQASCYKCHRMGIDGGILGPDLTSVAGRFGTKDLVDSIVNPSNVISDQYGATQFLTVNGDVVTGRVVNMRDNVYKVMTNMLDPSRLTDLKVDAIEETYQARVSMMPSNLLDTFSEDEINQLFAYLRAGGDPDHSTYNRKVAKRVP